MPTQNEPRRERVTGPSGTCRVTERASRAICAHRTLVRDAIFVRDERQAPRPLTVATPGADADASPERDSLQASHARLAALSAFGPGEAR